MRIGRRPPPSTDPPVPHEVDVRRPRRPSLEEQCSEDTLKGSRCSLWAGDDGRCHRHTRRLSTGPPAITAAAAVVEMEAQSWQTWRFGNRQWQNEAWRLYDLTGPLRYIANWAGNSASRARLYVAKAGADGEPVEETTDPAIAALAAGPLGTGPAKAEAIRVAVINLVVPGEVYAVAEADSGPDGEDRWWITPGRLIRRSGRDIAIRRPQGLGGGDMVYRPGVDIIIRIHTPHPADPDEADSPARSALPDLREIEAIRKREFAELDSRLAGAGLLPLPEDIDFPPPPDQPDNPGGVAGLQMMLMKAMATSMADRSSAAAMVPIMFRVKSEHLDKIKPVHFWSELSEQLPVLREAAVRGLAQSLDVPPEILLGQADSNHWCTTSDTQIMTRDGWKTHDQLTDGEQVLTLNHETGLSEWQEVLEVKTWDVVDEPMIAMRGWGHSSVTTPQHRWPILAGSKQNWRYRRWSTSDALMFRSEGASSPEAQVGNYLLLAAPSADLPTEPKYSDALVEMVAWYFTEGACHVRPGRRTPQVTIYQSHKVNPDNCARISRALTALFGPASEALDKGGRYATPASIERRAQARRLRAEHPHMSALEIGRRLGVSGTMVGKYLTADARVADAVPRWRMSSNRPDMTTFILNATAAEVILEHTRGRVVNLDFIHHLTMAQLELFIDVAVRGDGHITPNGTRYFGQKDPRMCDAIELAAILAGRYVNRYTVTGVGRSKDGPRRKTQHMVTIGSRTTFAPRGRSFSDVQYTGTIWCPRTPNQTWLARHQGTVFYTGNTAWQTAAEAVNIQVVPLLARLADALTTGWLKAALEDMGEDPDGFVYAFDVAALTAKPDRTDDAAKYHEDGLLSDLAAVVAAGWDEEHMPSDAERIRRLVEKIVVTNPMLLADKGIQQILGITIPITIQPAPPPAPPADDNPPTDDDEGGPKQIPDRKTEPPPPADAPPTSAAIHAVSDLAMRRAMALAGVKLIPRPQRANLADVPRHQLNVRYGPATPAQAEAALDGAWDDLIDVARSLSVDPYALRDLLHGFALELLTRGMGYTPDLLRDLVDVAVRGRRLDARLEVAR